MLLEKDMPKSPSIQFGKWVSEAVKAGVNAPTAMCLSTVGVFSRPTSRIVLMDNFTDNGIDFYSNYLSKKGGDLTHNPFASVLFFWPELQRQVRVQGKVIKQAPAASDAYFDARPEGHKISAWASNQSLIAESRQEMDDRFDTNCLIHKDHDIPRPVYWGGYVLMFNYFEFWEGRENRMHDRIVYRLRSGEWEIRRLQP